MRERLVAWLDVHGREPDADFILKAWLEAGGEFLVVKSPAIVWLRHNCEKAEAVYLTKFLAKQADIPVEAVKDILTWCRKFPENEDALWRLTQLRKHLLRTDVAEEVCTASEAVLRPSTSHEVRPSSLTRSQISTLISYLTEAPNLGSGKLRDRVDTLLVAWLRHPGSYGVDPKPYIYIQRQSYVQRVADLIDSGSLDVKADREPLKRFLLWVDCWAPERKAQIHRTLDFLKHKYPVPGLWDIVANR